MKILFAHDYNDNRVYIDETRSNCEYYCPACGAPLVTKKGEIRRHHFAHKSHHECSDSWARSNSYDDSEWHDSWQSEFPRHNQEVILTLGQTKHRADVLIGRTVVEFQHSLLSQTMFDERNNFYFSLGYKVIWLFDLTDLFNNGRLAFTEQEESIYFDWSNPKRAFNCYDVKYGCIDLFFQLREGDKQCIVRVIDVSERGFEQFETTRFLDKSEFLEYVGLRNGQCAEPDRDDLSKNESYLCFKDKYGISLNKQQERALQSIEGAVLLLSVPGSGKTTVLVARLGYMIIEKGIDPNTILAVTYNRSAAEEMKARFTKTFGKEKGRQVTIRTLNGFADKIYRDFCQRKESEPWRVIEGSELREILKSAYQKGSDEYPTEHEIQELQTAITYIKNVSLHKKIEEVDADIPHLQEMYDEYHNTLKNKKRIDFDDQILLACRILKQCPEILAEYRERFRYICVDEAQDTSKIQHHLIEMLAYGNNLFMVGDEDQSIYGFRGAHPRALLNFRYTYLNPFIMRMECNYRSTKQIVEKAQSFISANKGRYNKSMVSDRGDGEPVALISVKNRTEQFYRLVEIAKKRSAETAFLYRDNESSIVLVDLFLRNDVPFKLRKAVMNFLNTRVVRDVVGYLSFALNGHDIDSFRQVCNKGIVRFRKKFVDSVAQICSQKHVDVWTALFGQARSRQRHYEKRIEVFHQFMEGLKTKDTAEAIKEICSEGYHEYMESKELDLGKMELLLLLAEQEPDKSAFLRRLRYLEDFIHKDAQTPGVNPIILSTIHSSKGLEYDTVYMVDVYDGRFPSSRPNAFSKAKDNADGEQEERRLFYVGITRAKNRLFIMQLMDRESQYIAELFPNDPVVQERKRIEEEMQRAQCLLELREEAQARLRAYEARIRLQWEESAAREKERKRLLEAQRAREEKQRRIEEEQRARRAAEEARIFAQWWQTCEALFSQQEERVFDPSGKRWIKCEYCGQIKQDTEFCSYGGLNHVNLGICYDCARKNS